MMENDALIAAMLADEDVYLNPYIEDAINDSYSEDEQEDYNPTSKNVSRRPTKKRKLEETKKSTKIYNTSGKHVRAPWTDEEEKTFLIGLDTHGRDWTKISALFISRDPKNIRSHAQRHFIRLWYENKDLPAKVQESGKGHTLSGKPLDPDSGFAKRFLKNKPPRKTRFPLPNAITKNTKGSKINSFKVIRGKKKQEVIRKKKRSEKSNSKNKFNTADIANQAPLPRRYNPKRRRCNHSYKELCIKLDNADPHDLHKYQCYRSQFGIKQPFEVTVSPLAVTMADFHSHMLTDEEVIGLLVGSWDKDTQTLRVLCAKPCSSIQNGEDATVNVEMNPVSETEIREWIGTKEASTFCGVSEPVVVGWYHSHPVFEPIPSTKDIETHRQYQQLLEDSFVAWDNVPFVGLIVGPWDIGMINEMSVLKWFSVKNVEDMEHCGRGFPMRIDIKSDSEGITESQISFLKSQMLALGNEYRQASDFKALWRGFAYEKGEDGKYQRVLRSVTRLQKLTESLKADLKDLDVELTKDLLRDVLDSVTNKSLN